MSERLRAIAAALNELTTRSAQAELILVRESVGPLRRAIERLAELAPTGEEYRELARLLCPQRR